MKKYSITVLLTLLVLMVGGCGGKEPEGVPVVSVEDVQKADDAMQESKTDEEEKSKEKQPEEKRSEEDGEPEETSEGNPDEVPNVQKIPANTDEENLSGKVRSVGENSVVISKIFVEESEDGNSSIVFLPGEGGREEELVNVKFTDDTKFYYWTIKGGGGDIDMRDSSFSEISVNSGLEMNGHYEGDTFVAVKVIIEVYE